jgi:chromate reductase
MTTILAISGSLRGGSHNRALLRHAAEIAPGNVQIAFFDGLRDLPHYDPDVDGDTAPAAALALRDALTKADALLVSTPEYNGSIPGALKDAIDWASRPFRASALTGKPAAVVGATTGGYGAVWAQQDARKALGIAGAQVIEDKVAVGHAHESFDEDGALRSEEHAQDLLVVVESLAKAAQQVAAA